MESLINGGNSHSSSSSLDSLKPSVVVIILILLMTLLISVSICFLLRCLNRCSNGGSLSPSSLTTTVVSDSRRFSGHRVSPETERSSVLDSLPIFKFSSVTRRSTSSNSGDCAVCLSKFEPDDQLRLLPLCCHAFHADCIDIWLVSNQTCPLCRSPLFASESDLMKSLTGGNNNGGENSFRLEIGSISRRQIPIRTPESGDQNRSYSIGSFDYVVDDVESEISESDFNSRISTSRKQEDMTATATTTTAVAEVTSNPAFEASLAAEIGNEGSKSWLKEYVDRLSRGISSRAMSFRSSGRFFGGSSRRSDDMAVVDLEANLPGEEISELFRWLSGV